tara:strand:+ start:1552 stop:1710 length:159 start_codon:yes stop_codon:yes gene_type:complete
MGINLQILKILNEISKNNIIKGNILILGKQDFGASEIELKSLKPHLLNKKIS